MKTDAAKKFEEFIQIVKRLRDPVSGCPWDLAQTNESIRPYLVEECYEVLEAIDLKNDDELKKELGDVLLQVVLHAQIAADRKAFSIEDVVQLISEKMVRRHPHIFGGHIFGGMEDTKGLVEAKTAEDVKTNWERIKLEERKNAGENQQILAGVPKALPALVRAQRLGQKAAKFGFDWKELKDVWAKVEEELGELKIEIGSFDNPTSNKDRITAELGDLLFALSQLGRWLDTHTEDALRACCDRFTSRFNTVEGQLEKPMTEYTVEELEVLWQRAKLSEK
jgi:tetrapyrrole methylase family protein/MazG family protein